jgi:hypothetical protein
MHRTDEGSPRGSYHGWGEAAESFRSQWARVVPIKDGEEQTMEFRDTLDGAVNSQ